MSDHETEEVEKKPRKAKTVRRKKDDDDDDEKKPKRVRRTKKDKNAPKKGKTAFIIFSNETRPIVKDEQPELTFAEIAKEIASRWKAVDAATKKRVEKLAEKDKERYVKEMENYTPPDGESSAAAKKKSSKKRASKKKPVEGEEDNEEDDGDEE